MAQRQTARDIAAGESWAALENAGAGRSESSTNEIGIWNTGGWEAERLRLIERYLSRAMAICAAQINVVQSMAGGPELLENCTGDTQMPLPEEGELTMVKHRARVCVGFSDDGSPVVQQVSGRTEIDLSDNIVRAILNSARRSEFVSGEAAMPMPREQAPKFRDYAEEWLVTYKVGKIKPTTLGGYRTVLNAHLYQKWGDTPIDQITTKEIQEFLNTRKDRARKTIQEILMLLKAILESARQDRLIDKNPADDRRITNPSHRKTVRNALPVEDVKDIIEHLNALDNIDDRRFQALLIFTGMRRGEVLGLRWEDIDLTRGVIHVLRNVTFPKGVNEPCIGTPKTESGVRDIPFLPMMLDYLKPLGTEGFVLGGERPTTLSMHRRRMERIQRTVDIHGACPHVFRHSYATLLYDAGADVKTIQAIIGQRDFKTTADRYCHPRDSKKRAAVQGVKALLATEN